MEVRNRNPEQQGVTRPRSNDVTSMQYPRRRRKRALLTLLLLLFTLYLLPPLLLRYSSWCRDAITFVHHVKTPFFGNISDPESFGIKAVREFKLTHKDGCSLETWQILPTHYHHSINFLSEASYTNALSDGSPIIIYMHGNTGTRATHHRVQLYKYLAEILGYHVITFDYRGFGNSECYPSERGMMEDGRLVWKWVGEKAPRARIYIWGHSLGSAAATHLTEELCKTSRDMPSGLILDAPFPNMVAAAENHPFSLPYWPFMPIFSHFTIQNFEQKFESAKRMEHIKSPILILHGQMDYVIPYHLGVEVYETALKSREKNPYLGRVEFVDCGSSGHKTNWESPRAKDAVKQFVES